MTHLQRWPYGVGCGGSGARHHAISIPSKHHERPKHIHVLQAVPSLLLCHALLLPGLAQDAHIPIQAFLRLQAALANQW